LCKNLSFLLETFIEIDSFKGACETPTGGTRKIRIFGSFLISTSLESESHSWKQRWITF
jgi:hypothetical protein